MNRLLRQMQSRRPGELRAGVPIPVVLVSVALALSLSGLSASTFAAPVNVSLPTRSAAPGATVDLPIITDRSLAPLSVFSIDYRLPLDPAVVASASVLDDGLVQTWGPPTVNANTSFVAVAAAGVTPVIDNAMLIQTVRITLKSGIADQDLALTLPVMRLNEGAPSVAVTSGLLRIRGGVGVDDGPTGFALAMPVPNPARREMVSRFSLPTPCSSARVVVFGVDGRVVRTLFEGVATAGEHLLRWDLRDGAGLPVPAGIYLVRLSAGTRSALRRVAVLR